ncbi:MAG: TolC family protein [Tannerellaceae bacterium]|nr:TolC family protein [Tannerellaceae bacterium]
MKKIIVTSILLAGNFLGLSAQEEVWTLKDCMQYAVENSPKVKQKRYQADSYEADQLNALGAFLPYIEAGTSANFYFGRSLTEDNTYQDLSNFQNNYNLNASLPLFRGGQLIHQWKQAKVYKKLGKNDEQVVRDEVSMSILQAFADVIYYKEMVELASEKLEESTRTLIQSQRMEELGLKSKADVAQIEAQVAGDDYLLTHQQNMYNSSLLILKDLMNYPYDAPLFPDTAYLHTSYLPEPESIQDIFEYAQIANPVALSADYNLQAAKYQLKIAKGAWAPTISMSANVSTLYFTELSSSESAAPFKDQFKNKMGEYVGFSFSIPVFSRFTRVTGVRKARNSMRIAAEQQTETLRQIQTAIEQNVQDRNGYAKEIVQMEKQVHANEIAYRLTLRKYEEGLISSLDLQTSSYNLLQSRSNLLQRKLMYLIKDKIVDYYKGVPLIEE